VKVSLEEIKFYRGLFEDKICKANSFEIFSENKNLVFKVKTEKDKTFLMKIHKNEDCASIKNVENIMYDYLGNSSFVRKCAAKSSGTDADKVDYLILEYVEGSTLLEKLQRHEIEDLPSVIKQIAQYVKFCKNIKVSGFGNVNSNLEGEADTWYLFLESYLENALGKIKILNDCPDKEKLLNIHRILHQFFESNKEYFESVLPCLVPIDLNLSNFLVTKDNKLIVLDLDAFWSGDYLLAIGEFTGHSYATKHLNYFISEFQLSDFELKIVHFYALLSNFDVLLYIAQFELDNLHQQKPWGNSVNFFKLARSHEFMLKNEINGYPCNLIAKSYFWDGDWGVKISSDHERTVSFEDTLAKIESIKHFAGITRVSEITGLDSTGIIAYQCIRPDAEENDGTFTVFSGRGLSKDQCRVSAIVEGIERFCAEKRNYDKEKLIIDSYANLIKKFNVIIPDEFNAPKDINFSEDEVLEWVPAKNILTGKIYYVTANTVFYPYSPDVGRMLFRYFTTGLAAGNTYLEALSHSIAEVIERDAAALNLILRNCPSVDINTINSEKANEIIEKIRGANSNLNIIIRYISAPDIDIPVFSVIIEDTDLQDPLYVSGGYGCHPNKELALINALNEAALSRVSTVSGAREDLKKFRESKQSITYDEYKKKYAYWFSLSNNIDYNSIPTYEFPTVLEDIWHMCNCVKKAGFTKILMADLSKEDLKLPVIKTLIPGIERYSFKMTCIGQRARKYYYSLYKKELK
jgi:ribosomal protein S12 methylthiotransferase accessory factor